MRSKLTKFVTAVVLCAAILVAVIVRIYDSPAADIVCQPQAQEVASWGGHNKGI